MLSDSKYKRQGIMPHKLRILDHSGFSLVLNLRNFSFFLINPEQNI